MQAPTCTGIRIRSARDANILFHGVALGHLPLITRRLDEAERLQVKSGCVYVWEERNPSYFDFNGQEMKRFTEGASIPRREFSPRSSQFSCRFHQEGAGVPPRPEMYAARFRLIRLFAYFSSSRQEFLFYYEKENGIKSQMVERMKSGPRTCVVGLFPARSRFPLTRTYTSTRTQLVKQTYSVNVHTQGSSTVRKWHLSKYSFPCIRQTLTDPTIRRLLLC